ncbi:MAG: SDR family oxidoreductase [bacterium]|nr:SDR family oxidoreductase [bacterium]MDE0352838.1 SDR family oxidoreductase [bacterium]
MARVLVLGASGYVGSHLIPRLVERGHQVRAAGRRPEALAGRGWEGVETVRADALDPGSLVEAFEGIELVYYLIHSMASGKDFPELDRRAATHVRDAAATAGVGGIIYLGGLQPREVASAHLDSRRETGEVLRSGSVPVTEIRAGIVVGPGSAAFEVIRDLVYHLPVMVTPRWVDSMTQPIALDDLIEYLLRLLEAEGSESRIHDVGGPEALRYRDLLTGFARVIGKRLLIVPVPVLTPRLSSYWLNLVTAVPASVARPLIDGLRHDLVIDPVADLATSIPLPLHTYEEAISAALEAEQDAEMPARWTEGSFAMRDYRSDVSFYSRGERVERLCEAAPETVWEVVSSIGGTNGWYYADPLWNLRGILDRMVGGVGRRRGRRHPTRLRVGDAVDFWRVVAIEPGRRLTLLAEMRLPGTAVLEFEVLPEADGSRTVTAAYFHPAGVLGLLYWYALWPIHKRIFAGLADAIVKRSLDRMPAKVRVVPHSS